MTLRIQTKATSRVKLSFWALLLSGKISSGSGFIAPFSSNDATPFALHLGIRNNAASARSMSPTSAAEVGKEDETSTLQAPFKVVVVGGGWAGFTAADALSSAVPSNNQDVEITILDAAPRGKGGLAGGWRTEAGRPVEAGIHGFWREYRNTFQVMTNRIGLSDLNQVLSPFTPSILVSQSGKVAVAPVLKEENDNDAKRTTRSSSRIGLQASPIETMARLLPPPLDLALTSDFQPNRNQLTTLDRISALGLLGAWADFGQEDEASWKRYDAISAEELFLSKAGITKRLYEELVLPLLHVLPMSTGYDCSAAAALSCFHVFALQSKGAFDVRWCRGGIAEAIFNPWVDRMLETKRIKIEGGARVTEICQLVDKKDSDNPPLHPMQVSLQDGRQLECDAVVLAVGGVAIGKLTQSSPVLQAIPQSSQFSKLDGVTCVAVRLFLKPHARITSDLEGGLHSSTQLPPAMAASMKESPVIVCGANVGGLPELKETGFCLYDLQRMHDEFQAPNDVAVLEVDFFRADDIANIEDDNEVARLTLRAAAAALGVPQIPISDVVDVAVVRARRAVSHFRVGSQSCSPTRPKLGKGIYVCGDWVDRSGHASWSTEKAVVTGKQAAQAISNDFGLNCAKGALHIIPAATDTPQLKLLQRGANILRSVIPPPGDGVPSSPWSFAQQLLTKQSKSSSSNQQ
jgi:uncharacterized protein with NAD-binding domain and iron-sulfur cluster